MTPNPPDPAGLREIADELHRCVVARHPFAATEDGLLGFDDQIPDLTADAARTHRRTLEALRSRARSAPVSSLPDQVTADLILHTIDRELVLLEHGGIEHTVSTILADGPSAVLGTAFLTRPADPSAARDYLVRCGAFAEYLDAHAALLTAGARDGRFPVASLVRAALAQVDGYLARDDEDVVADVPAPPGWAGAGRWRARLHELAGSSVRPAMRRWRSTVAALPTRTDDHCGLVHLPGGEQDYSALVRIHTTLPADPSDLHDIGRTQVAALTVELTERGAALGLHDCAEVLAAFLASASAARAEAIPLACRNALRKGESSLPAVIGDPLPPQCAIAAMPEHLGNTGHAPHYTSPRLDGTRAGTFWYNAQQPDAGGGWASAALTYHEAVPGHHLQVSRAQLLDDLPELQRHGFVTAHGEGWALYAELLACELGLYATPEDEIGALVLRLFRAARLVVDTGIHALGWTLREATEWLCRTVPVPRDFARAEVRRYVGAPAQALSYTTGFLEILRLREDARRRLGERFDLRAFHGVILDSGSVPLTSLQRLVDHWIAS